MKLDGLDTSPTPLERENPGLPSTQEPSWNVKALSPPVGRSHVWQRQLVKELEHREVSSHEGVAVLSGIFICPHGVPETRRKRKRERKRGKADGRKGTLPAAGDMFIIKQQTHHTHHAHHTPHTPSPPHHTPPSHKWSQNFLTFRSKLYPIDRLCTSIFAIFF